MGEDEKRPQLYANVCGEWKPVTPIDTTPVLEAASSWTDAAELLAAPIRIRGKLPKYFRCRSRKRLIKLLMANKLSWREAEEVAWIINNTGESYHDAWQRIWPQLLFL